MKVATYRLRPDTPGAPPDLPPEVTWARFGDELLLVSDETRGDVRRERGLRERQTDVERENLHVVVQNGRLFQQEHPDVRVILDRGRLLLVELDPNRARRLDEENETCYGVLPLKENQIVFDVHEPTAARTTPVAWIQDLVDKVSRPSLEADLAHLV
jgi:hypothetical protein